MSTNNVFKGNLVRLERISKGLRENEIAEGALKCIQLIYYMVGIAERGRGQMCSDTDDPGQFLLEYVKDLEAASRLVPVSADAQQVTATKLTDEEIASIWNFCNEPEHVERLREFARAIERKLQVPATVMPEGWQVIDEGERVIVQHIDGTFYAARDDFGTDYISENILARFARAVLAQCALSTESMSSEGGGNG